MPAADQTLIRQGRVAHARVRWQPWQNAREGLLEQLTDQANVPTL